MVTIFIRTILVYVFLVLMMRLMGKRQIGELEISELITTLLLSEIASMPITNLELPVTFAVIPIITLVTLEIVLSVLMIKFPSMKNLLSQRPNFIINKGKLCQSELKRLRMSNDELISALRQAGITSIDEVYYAIVEENGTLTVIPKKENSPLTLSDLKKAPEEKGMTHILISDGKINSHGLSCSNLTKKKLSAHLKKQGNEISDVFLMLCDDAGNYNVILKEKKK